MNPSSICEQNLSEIFAGKRPRLPSTANNKTLEKYRMIFSATLALILFVLLAIIVVEDCSQ